MPAPNNPATARVALAVTRDQRRLINTFHAATDDGSPIVASDLTTLTDLFADWWDEVYRLRCQNLISGFSVTATKQDPADPLQETVALTTNGSSTATGVTPASATAAVSWRTGLAGRKYRGRYYHFNMPLANLTTADTIIGAFVADLGAVALSLITRYIGTGLLPVVFHRSTNTYTQILASVVENLLDSQRRRLANRGI